MDRAPWAPSDRVLRQSDLGRMVDLLDPTGRPQLVLMSAQTFYLLLPFYADERESAAFSPDQSAFHFDYGARTILVSAAWDFTLGGPRMDEPAAAVAGPPSDVRTFLSEASRAFPELDLREHPEALVLVGGWRPAFVDELRSLSAAVPLIRSMSSVPGLNAFVVDGPALVEALQR